MRLAATPPPGLAGAATQPTLVAKLFDVDAAGTRTLVRNLVSPLRIPDTSAPLRIELPGIVHRFAAGDRLQLVLATGDSAYVGSKFPYTVTVTDSPVAPNTLDVPLVSAAGLASGPGADVPEAPLALLLPLAAAGVAGAVVVRRRRPAAAI